MTDLRRLFAPALLRTAERLFRLPGGRLFSRPLPSEFPDPALQLSRALEGMVTEGPVTDALAAPSLEPLRRRGTPPSAPEPVSRRGGDAPTTDAAHRKDLRGRALPAGVPPAAFRAPAPDSSAHLRSTSPSERSAEASPSSVDARPGDQARPPRNEMGSGMLRASSPPSLPRPSGTAQGSPTPESRRVAPPPAEGSRPGTPPPETDPPAAWPWRPGPRTGDMRTRGGASHLTSILETHRAPRPEATPGVPAREPATPPSSPPQDAALTLPADPPRGLRPEDVEQVLELLQERLEAEVQRTYGTAAE